jgi:hypothetical protein
MCFHLVVNKSPIFMTSFLIHGDCVFPPKSKKQQSWYEFIWKFFISWAMKLPWVELQIGSYGHAYIVRYKVCLYMEHKNKILTLNWDSFQIYVSCKKIEKVWVGWKRGAWIMNMTKMRLFMPPRVMRSMLQLVVNEVVGENVRSLYNFPPCSTPCNMVGWCWNMRLTKSSLIFWMWNTTPKCIGKIQWNELWFNPHKIVLDATIVVVVAT